MSDAEISVILNELTHIKSAINEVKEKVDKTNGRVTALERWKLVFMTAIGVLILTQGGADALLSVVRLAAL